LIEQKFNLLRVRVYLMRAFFTAFGLLILTKALNLASQNPPTHVVSRFKKIRTALNSPAFGPSTWPPLWTLCI